MNPPLLPEEQARVLIDEQLTRAGWFVCDRKDIDLVNHQGNAVGATTHCNHLVAGINQRDYRAHPQLGPAREAAR